MTNSSSDAAFSFASPRGCPDANGADEPGVYLQEEGAAKRIAEPAEHAIPALSSAASPSQSQPRSHRWGCTQVLLAPRSARSQMVLILSLALAAGGQHGAAAQQTCPTYTVTPAVQTNCTIPTYDPTTCVLYTWCLT